MRHIKGDEYVRAVRRRIILRRLQHLVVPRHVQRAGAVLAVAERAAGLGWHTVDVTASPLPGPSGNVEYFLRLRGQTEGALDGEALRDAVRRAVAEGPQ